MSFERYQTDSGMGRRIFIPVIMAIILFPSGQAMSSTTLYDQRVILARNGDYEPLLEYLRHQQLSHHPITNEQIADWIQVASWAGQDHEAVSTWKRFQDNKTLPVRAMAAAAQSYRNLKSWESSLALWERICSQEPDNDDYHIAWIKTLADAGKTDIAFSLVTEMVKKQPNLAHLQTMSYVYLRQGKSWDKLLSDTRAYLISPDNKDIVRTLSESLKQNRISGPAQRFAITADVIKEQQHILDTDKAAELVRLSVTAPPSEKERYVIPQKALEDYKALFLTSRVGVDLTRASIDRLGALVAHEYYDDAIIEYERLNSQHVDIPPYALTWVVTAYIAKKRTQEAFKIVKTIPDYYPGSDMEKHEVFYSFLETGKYADAKKYYEKIINTEPYTLHYYRYPVEEPNDRWLEGQFLYLQYLLNTNEQSTAENLARKMAESAPGNQGLRIGYAELLKNRGLLHSAERVLKRAEALEPSNTELERQQAWVAMELHEWKQMDLLTKDVFSRHPLDFTLQPLLKARETHYKSELRIQGSQGLYSGNPISGANDRDWKVALYSPPWATDWRFFGSTNLVAGRFEEGKAMNRNVFSGLEWRPRDNWVEMELSSHHFHNRNKMGGRISVWHDFSDHWRLGGEVERISANTPLQALYEGISSNRNAVWLRWYRNERREYSLGFAASDFTDHNHRYEYTFKGKERLWQSPTITLDLHPEISASKNNRSNTVYYNPKLDLSSIALVTADHKMYQHYDTVWNEQFSVGGGAGWEKNYNTKAIAIFGYGQRIQWNSNAEAGVMLTWDSRPYDGIREDNISMDFDITLRF